MPLEGGQVRGRHPGQFDVDDVVALLLVDVAVHAVADPAQLVPGPQDALAEHEPDGKFEVGPRGAHGHGHRVAGAAAQQTDFEGLLGGQGILAPMSLTRPDLPGPIPAPWALAGPGPRLIPRAGRGRAGRGRTSTRTTAV